MGESGLRIHVRHIRAAGFCLRPAREWWFPHHKLSWSDFLTEGLSAEFLRGLNDGIANRVIAAAEAEEANNGR